MHANTRKKGKGVPGLLSNLLLSAGNSTPDLVFSGGRAMVFRDFYLFRTNAASLAGVTSEYWGRQSTFQWWYHRPIPDDAKLLSVLLGSIMGSDEERPPNRYGRPGYGSGSACGYCRA